MRILVISIFLITTLFSFILKYLNYTKRNAPLPDNVKDIYDKEEYVKQQAYEMEKLRYSIFTSIITRSIFLVMLVFNVYFQVFDFLSAYTSNIYLLSLGLMLIPEFAEMIIESLLGIYNTFVIEGKYGFNKTTPKTYVLDFIKNTLFFVVITSVLVSLFIFLDATFGNIVYPAFFVVFLVFAVSAQILSPFIIRLYYKLTPLEDGSLKDRINALAEKHNFRIKNIYRVDASKRTTKLNAFATGFGKTKTIGMFDTLLEKMTEDEVVGIVAHEIGHAKHNHTMKGIPLSIIAFIIMLTGAFFIFTNPSFAQAFGFQYENIAFGVVILTVFISPINLILSIPAMAQSRKHEIEADTLFCETVGSEVSISAIKKGVRENFGNLTPHPLVVKLKHRHPTASQRIAYFEKLNLKPAPEHIAATELIEVKV